MSPRRRLRTRYEPGGPTHRAPARAQESKIVTPPARPEPPEPPEPEGSLVTAAPSEPAPLVEKPVPPPLARPEPPDPPEPEGSLLTGAPAEPAPLVASPKAPAAPAEPADSAPAIPGRPSAEVIEEWARAFEEPAESPPTPAPEKKPWRRLTLPRVRLRPILTWIAIALLAFATGLFLFNNFVMPRLIHGVGQVTVPDLTNLTVEQAEQALRSLGLQVSRAGERFDPAAPRGFVIAQDPIAGSTVRGRKRVSVIVSLGEEYSSVPELFGESVRGAHVLLERAGLQQGSTVQAPSDEAGEGLVAASDPGAEAVLQRNTPVHLLVSTGTEAESFVMPELLGREIGGVRRQLEAMGFRIERSGSRNSVGTIVAQVPAPGSRISRGVVIQLTASGRIIR